MVQVSTPDELRGRVTSIHFLVVSGGPRLGDIEAAAMASAIGAQGAVVVGALLCLAGTAGVARAFPELVRHRVLRASRPRQSIETPASA